MPKRKISAKSTATGEKPTVEIKIDRSPKSEWKALGGGDRDQWNERLANLVHKSPPCRSIKCRSCFRGRVRCCCWRGGHEARRSGRGHADGSIGWEAPQRRPSFIACTNARRAGMSCQIT